MQYRKLSNTDISVPVISLGTWAFGSDKWWGRQNDKDSEKVLDTAIAKGITTIDTAPVYGRGHSEEVIGRFLKKRNLRGSVVLATKLGLSWHGAKISHNLKRKRMLEEIDESRTRLQTDYIDIYQVHWPDPDTPIQETAQTMLEFYEKGIIKAVGVSNYSAKQMEEFKKYCPLHSTQPQYSMFERNIESNTVPFCIENNISILSYAPLYSGVLTGKFFFDNAPIPTDINRKMKKTDFEEPKLSINKETLEKLKAIAKNYDKNLTQLAINWNLNQKGITSTLVGTRNIRQLEDNLGGEGWEMSDEDMEKISLILKEREEAISKIK